MQNQDQPSSRITKLAGGSAAATLLLTGVLTKHGIYPGTDDPLVNATWAIAAVLIVLICAVAAVVIVVQRQR